MVVLVDHYVYSEQFEVVSPFEGINKGKGCLNYVSCNRFYLWQNDLVKVNTTVLFAHVLVKLLVGQLVGLFESAVVSQ